MNILKLISVHHIIIYEHCKFILHMFRSILMQMRFS